MIPMQSTMKKYVCKVTKKCYTKENDAGLSGIMSAQRNMAGWYYIERGDYGFFRSFADNQSS